MQHRNKIRTFGRDRDERKALLRGLSLSLIERGKIVTTLAKAKELRPYVEKVITAAKIDTVASRRKVMSNLGEPKDTLVKKLFADIAPKYKERNGGYTRIVKMGRSLAGRDEALIELV